MIDKICDWFMKRIKLKMPDIDEEQAEVIRYGFELMIGEIPKMFLLLIIAWALGIINYAILSFLIILPYRLAAGGVHLKSHLGCILGTTAFYCGNVYISKFINFPNLASKLVVSIIILIFSITMISLYAPADTENVPILRKKDRRNKKIISYIIVVAMVVISFFIENNTISNMFIIGMLLQSCMISKLMYSIFKIKFGYLEYIKTQKNAT